MNRNSQLTTNQQHRVISREMVYLSLFISQRNILRVSTSQHSEMRVHKNPLVVTGSHTWYRIQPVALDCASPAYCVCAKTRVRSDLEQKKTIQGLRWFLGDAFFFFFSQIEGRSFYFKSHGCFYVIDFLMFFACVQEVVGTNLQKSHTLS